MVKQNDAPRKVQAEFPASSDSGGGPKSNPHRNPGTLNAPFQCGAGGKTRYLSENPAVTVSVRLRIADPQFAGHAEG